MCYDKLVKTFVIAPRIRQERILLKPTLYFCPQFKMESDFSDAVILAHSKSLRGQGSHTQSRS